MMPSFWLHLSILSSQTFLLPLFHFFLPSYFYLFTPFTYILFSFFVSLTPPFFLVSSFRPVAHHLSPQALKWREYRRKNPLGVEKKRDVCCSSPSSSSSSCSLSASAALKARRRTVRRNVFDFPPTNQALNFSRLNGAHLNLISLRVHLWSFLLTSTFLTVHVQQLLDQ